MTTSLLEGEKQSNYLTQDEKPPPESPLDAIMDQSEDEEQLSKPRIVLLNISWFGLQMMFLLLTVEVVPAQIQTLVGERAKGRWLGGMVAVGAAATFFASPVIGTISDRMTTRAGRRRPVMAMGALALCTGLVGMALSVPHVTMIQNFDDEEIGINSTGLCNRDLVAHRCSAFLPETNITSKQVDHPTDIPESRPEDIALFVTFYLVVTTAFATVYVPYNALIADKSTRSQRGFNSGVMGAMILLGNVCGAAVGTSFTTIGVLGAYGCAIAVVVVSLLVTICTTTEKVPKTVVKPIECINVFCGFWEPLKDSDFRWVFITRFLMQQGVSTVVGFLEYWLADMVPLPNCWSAATAVALMLLPMLFAAAVSSVIFGVISDRTGRRKPIVICAAAIMCCCVLTLTLIRTRSAYYIAVTLAFCFGIGFGSYQSVDFALVMDVLPNEADKAKDIAVWSQALVLPNALATPIGGFIIDYFEKLNCEVGLGYILLFVVTGFYFLLSGIFVVKIKKAR